jgi:hypothetical protein
VSHRETSNVVVVTEAKAFMRRNQVVDRPREHMVLLFQMTHFGFHVLKANLEATNVLGNPVVNNVDLFHHIIELKGYIS